MAPAGPFVHQCGGDAPPRLRLGEQGADLCRGGERNDGEVGDGGAVCVGIVFDLVLVGWGGGCGFGEEVVDSFIILDAEIRERVGECREKGVERETHDFEELAFDFVFPSFCLHKLCRFENLFDCSWDHALCSFHLGKKKSRIGISVERRGR